MITHRLSSEIIPLKEIDTDFTVSLYQLFETYYENVTFSMFQSDLAEKDFIVLLRDLKTRNICGFSTQQLLRLNINGEQIRVLFSGDTIIDPQYWGEQELVRGWCNIAGRLLAEEATPLYWLLISKGFRTYLYLPVFYHEYWPRHDCSTPLAMQQIIDALALAKWPQYYQKSSGLLEFPSSRGNLKSAIADVPTARFDDPHVRFFLQRNPTFQEGSELVCLAPITLQNTKSIGRRLIQMAMRNHQHHGVANSA